MKRSLLKWEATGIGVIFLLGAFFHFIFELTGSLAPIGAFAPVNESVYEHLKMTFWPTVLYAAFSYCFIKASANNFITGKAAALIVMPLIILGLFYGYTTLTGTENVIIDILIFLVAVAGGQLVSYQILKSKPLPVWLTRISLFVIIGLAIMYAVLTFLPPHVQLFIDTNTNTYGIPSQ